VTATVVRPHVTVTVHRYRSGAVDLHITSTAGKDQYTRWRPEQAGMAVEVVESFRGKGATIEEEEG
jgi:hypothetical protein